MSLEPIVRVCCAEDALRAVEADRTGKYAGGYHGDESTAIHARTYLEVACRRHDSGHELTLGTTSPRAGTDDSSPSVDMVPRMALDTSNRHPSVAAVTRFLDSAHLPPSLSRVAVVFEDAARKVLELVPVDDPELTVAIRKLLEGKDAAVWAFVSTEGVHDRRPGPGALTGRPLTEEERVTGQYVVDGGEQSRPLEADELAAGRLRS